MPPDQEFPTERTNFERDLGFHCYWVVGLGGTPSHPEPATVIARLLSSSDILVKRLTPGGKLQYSHYRWGYDASLPADSQIVEWWPIEQLDPPEIASFIQQFGSVERPSFSAPVTGLPFDYRET